MNSNTTREPNKIIYMPKKDREIAGTDLRTLKISNTLIINPDILKLC